MEVKVKLFGTLRRYSNSPTKGVWEGEIKKGSSLAELIKIIGISKKEIAAITMNNNLCSLDKEIPEDAQIVMVTHIGGG